VLSPPLSPTPACRSYNEWKQEKERGTAATAGTAAGSSSSATGGSSAGAAVRGAAQEAADTARSAKDVVKMEDQAAGRVDSTLRLYLWSAVLL
jgi:hypothetical protein